MLESLEGGGGGGLRTLSVIVKQDRLPTSGRVPVIQRNPSAGLQITADIGYKNHESHNHSQHSCIIQNDRLIDQDEHMIDPSDRFELDERIGGQAVLDPSSKEVRGEPLNDAFPTSIQLQDAFDMFSESYDPRYFLDELCETSRPESENPTEHFPPQSEIFKPTSEPSREEDETDLLEETGCYCSSNSQNSLESSSSSRDTSRVEEGVFRTRLNIVEKYDNTLTNSTPPPLSIELQWDLLAKPKPKKRGRKKGYRSENTNSEGTICSICGDKAGRHSYYGGISCQSCRAFFRRSVQSGNYKHFSCLDMNPCLIKQSIRKKCKFCRFKSCLQSGMKVSYVLSSKNSDSTGVDLFTEDSQADKSGLRGLREYPEFTLLQANYVYSTWNTVFYDVPSFSSFSFGKDGLQVFIISRVNELVERLLSDPATTGLLKPDSYSSKSSIFDTSRIPHLSLLTQIVLSGDPLCWSDWFLDLVGSGEDEEERKEEERSKKRDEEKKRERRDDERKWRMKEELEEENSMFEYQEMYPRGWCVSPDLEETHWQLWCRVRDYLNDKVLFSLIFILILTKPEQGQIRILRLLQGYLWSLGERNHRSRFGNCLLTGNLIQEIQEINKLRIL